jgi:hypothetical protein
MPTVQITINQAGKPAGIPGESRDDLALGIPVTLSNHDNTGIIAWNWRLLAAPSESAAAIGTPTGATCQFTPDVAGSYLLQLLANGRIRQTAVAAVKTAFLGMRLPAEGEATELGGWGQATNANLVALEGAVQSGGVPNHHARHENGGADEVNVAGLSGLLADPQTPLAHAASHQNGGGDEIGVGGLSGLLADSQIAGYMYDVGHPISPTLPAPGDAMTWDGAAWGPVGGVSPHDWTHEAGGSDEISVEGLSGRLANRQLAGYVYDIGQPIAAGPPAPGDVLTWGGSTWAPVAPTGGSGVDRFLVFSDDTQFAEAGGTFVTKKTFRIVRDSDSPPIRWRIVVSMWGGGELDTVECRVQAVGSGGTDSATLPAVVGPSETIVSGNIDISGINEPENSMITINIQLRLAAGGGPANLKYTDIYAAYTPAP